MSGSHYNRAWRVHEAASEAMERILFKRFICEVKPTLSKELINLTSEDPESITFDSVDLCESLWERFEAFKRRVEGN